MIKNKKVGGIRFITIGRVNLTYSVKRKQSKQDSGIYQIQGVQAVECCIAIAIGAIFSLPLFATFY